MALYDDEPFEPPPVVPPVPDGGQVGTNIPPGNPGTGGGSEPAPFVPPLGGGGGGAPAYGQPTFPTFNIPGAPQFKAPTFNRPTLESAMNEPGYAMRLRAGQDAMERSAAARGLLRTGGTLSNLLEHSQNFAAQEYANVFNRELQNYDRSYRAAHDAFAPEFARWQTLADAQKQASLMNFGNEWQRHLQSIPRPGGGGGDNIPWDFIMNEPPPPWEVNDPGTPGGYDAMGDPWTDREIPYY